MFKSKKKRFFLVVRHFFAVIVVIHAELVAVPLVKERSIFDHGHDGVDEFVLDVVECDSGVFSPFDEPLVVAFHGRIDSASTAFNSTNTAFNFETVGRIRIKRYAHHILTDTQEG